MKYLPEKPRYTAIGLMSGTSMDAIEAALVKFTGAGLDTRVEFVGHLGAAWPPLLKNLIVSAATGSLDTVTLARLDKAVAEAFAATAKACAREHSLEMADIDFIASHGQTSGHWPQPAACGEYPVRASLQLGDGAVIAARTGVTTVCDFRAADLARGGQGAPLVPYFDYLIYRHYARGRVLLNLGGIANLTVLPEQCTLADVTGFDTGPANVLSDLLVERLSGGRRLFDEDGAMALAGRPDMALLKALLMHPYLKAPPPKSVDRSVFGEVLVNYLLTHRGHNRDEDLVATAAAFTVESIAVGVEEFVTNRHLIEEVIVSGGGVHNAFFMRDLARRLPALSFTHADEYGIPSQAKEAVAFAWLGLECLAGNPGNLPAVTGANSRAILGKICPA